MTPVRVGDVRRLPPVDMGSGNKYYFPPFEVRAVDAAGVRVLYVDERGERTLHPPDVDRCPIWPAEHEQWKDAMGYNVEVYNDR